MTGVPSPRRREATRERLLDAARSVLAETGIQGATVETICDRAGFSRGAFYSNFATKDELVMATFQRETSQLLAGLRAAIASEPAGDDDFGALWRMVRFFVENYASDRTSFLIRSEFATHAARHPEIAVMYSALWQDLIDELTRLVSDGAKRLDLTFSVPSESIALMLLGGFEIAARKFFVENRADDYDGQYLDEVVEVILQPVLIDGSASA